MRRNDVIDGRRILDRENIAGGTLVVVGG